MSEFRVKKITIQIFGNIFLIPWWKQASIAFSANRKANCLHACKCSWFLAWLGSADIAL